MKNLKTKFIYTLAILLLTIATFAQAPEKMSYQAVVRDASEALFANQQVGMQISILEGSIAGTPVYVETQTPTTNINGLISIEIGTGTLVSGDFTTIDWGNNTYYIKTEIDLTGGATYTITGTNQLMSVPYALYAKTSGSAAPTNQITDTDNDTKIQVEETADEDIIRFDIAGTEQWIMTETRLEPVNTGNSIFIGEGAGLNDDLSNNRNIFIGSQTGQENTTGSGNTASGYQALISNTTGVSNTVSGRNSLKNNIVGNSNVAIGRGAGFSSLGDANVYLGYSAGYRETGSNKLYIENTNSATPLIYGEFDNDLLRVNGKLNINNEFSFPTTDGTVNQVLETDGSGNLTWQTNTGVVQTEITDADSDTKIQVEKTADEDIIRFDLGGTEYFTMNNGRLNVLNTGGSVFIGEDAGLNDDFSNNGNTFIGTQTGLNTTTGSANSANGYLSLKANTTGIGNTANGYQTMLSNTTGDNNVVNGNQALILNTTGSSNTAIGTSALSGGNTTGSNNVALGALSGYFSTGNANVYLGRRAGFNATGSNKLYIENTISDDPLIYGEFDNDLLRVNGTLNINNEFSFPTTDGTVNQVLETDGSGNLTWQTNTGVVQTEITDTDNDTKIQVEETADEDIIRFDLGGTEYFTMNSGRLNVLNTGNSVFIGKDAGLNDDLTGNANVFIGRRSGIFNTTGDNNNAIGEQTLEDNITGDRNVAIGDAALSNNIDGDNNTAIGDFTLRSNTSGENNTALGSGADVATGNLTNATAIGYRASVATSNSMVLGGTGSNAVNVGIGTTSPTELLTLAGTSGTDGILFPDNTLQTTAFTGSVTVNEITDADNNTKIQVEETANEDIIRFDIAGTQRMMIDNNGFVGVGSSNPTANLTVNGTATTNTEIAHFSNSNNAKKASISLSNAGAGQMALLDGSNNTDVLVSASDNTYFNAANVGIGNTNPQEKLHVTGNIRMEDGNQGLGKLMTSDADGTATWTTNTGIVQTQITDADNDTKIQVDEGNGDEDVIRFDIAGTEQWRMTKTRLAPVNAGNSVFIGLGAGNADDLTDNGNTAIGHLAGKFNTTGNNNVFIGKEAGHYSFSGSGNTFLGESAGRTNSSGVSNTYIGRGAGMINIGSGNIFLGAESGSNEMGSNKLYIENTGSSLPLIYGEFDNDLLRINGELEIENDLNVSGNTVASGDVVLAANPGSKTTIGVTGTQISYIIKKDVVKDVGSIASDGQLNVDFNVPDVLTGSSVMVSPSGDLPNQVFIGQARVSSAGTVRVRFHNESNSSKDPGNMIYYITVIK